jgi:cytochrome c biogenesis protein
MTEGWTGRSDPVSRDEQAGRNDPAPVGGRTGQRGLAAARGFWRWLTSMRTALVLLLFLAVAAVPGSIWPQRNVSAEAVSLYFQRHPALAPFLNRLWAFDVYASPWFSAIYLLLFVSLVG